MHQTCPICGCAVIDEYIFVNIFSSSSPKFNCGYSEGVSIGSSIIYAGTSCTNTSQLELEDKIDTCICDIRDLMIRGCKCGFLKKDE